VFCVHNIDIYLTCSSSSSFWFLKTRHVFVALRPFKFFDFDIKDQRYGGRHQVEHTTMAGAGTLRLPASSRTRWSVHIMILIAFLLGTLFGYVSRGSVTTKPKAPVVQQHGSVLRLSEIPSRPTSHSDEQGRPITKQQLVDPFVVPNFAGFSIATLLPNQRISSHQHDTMHEFFYIVSGTGVLQINGVDHSLAAGSFVHAVPGERHSFWASPETQEAMKMIVFGVTTGPKRTRIR
jgi:quercetin dioxygenase-like cupin family protein